MADQSAILTSKNTSKSIYLYLPNIVGYVRLFVLIYGLCVVRDEPLFGIVVLFFGGLLDALDGFLARYLKQTSDFGAILDYALDRVAATSYFFLVASVYPDYWLILCFLLNFDIASHLFHLKASIAQKKTSHKETSSEDPPLLRLYYKSRFMLFMTCFTHDLFLAFLYLYKFYPTMYIEIGLLVTSVGFIFKTAVHITKIIHASKAIVCREQES